MYWHLRYEVVGDVSAGDAWLGGGGQEYSIRLRACKKPLKLKYVCLSFSSKSRQHLSTHIYLDELMILNEKQLNPKFKTYNCQLNQSFGDCITEPSQPKYLPCHPEILLVSS